MHADLLLLQQGQPIARPGALRRIAVAGGAVALVLAAVCVTMFRDGGTPGPHRPNPPAPAVGLPSHVASLPAADVLKIAYGGAPPPPPTQFERPRLSVRLRAKRAGESAFVPLNDGEPVASEKDDYQIIAQAFSGGYLYVFQVDSSGKKEWLFPANETSAVSSGSNPVQAGQTIQIPSAESKRALYLDTTTGYEHVYAVLSAARWPELEHALAQPGPTAAATVLEPNALRLRGVAGDRVTDASEPLEAEGPVLVIERWFQHVAAP
jgi:hypothetical protein